MHILVNSKTASYPCWTDWPKRAANSELLKILREHVGGILHTVVGWNPWWWLQFRDCTKIALSERHSANTSPFMYVNRTPMKFRILHQKIKIYMNSKIKIFIWWIEWFCNCLPLPMWRRVFSIVEFRLTFESCPRQNL